MKLTCKTNVAGLVKAFESMPDKTREMVRQVVKTTARNIKARASQYHAYTSRSGMMERQGVQYVSQDNIATIYLSDRVPYGKYLHEGTKAHQIVPRKRTVLRWVSRGEMAFAKRVRVSGIKPDPFLYRAAQNEVPNMEKRLDIAVKKLLEGR